MATAIYNAQANTVKTFIRDDYPDGYTPPSGYTLVPSDELPQGWEMEVDTSHQDALLELRSQAKQMLDEQQAANSAVLRGLVLVLIDEVNNLRQWNTALKTQIGLSTNLGNLQTRIAQFPDLPDRTGQQARDAIKSQIDAGSADE